MSFLQAVLKIINLTVAFQVLPLRSRPAALSTKEGGDNYFQSLLLCVCLVLSSSS